MLITIVKEARPTYLPLTEQRSLQRADLQYTGNDIRHIQLSDGPIGGFGVQFPSYPRVSNNHDFENQSYSKVRGDALGYTYLSLIVSHAAAY